MMQVAAYLRVSTDGQLGDDKFGLDVQKESIIDYCKRNDMNIINWFVDEGESGAKERAGFDEIVYGEVTNPPYEAVIVAKTDRVARDINVYYYYKMLLQKKDIKLISIAEDFGQFGAFSSILEAFTICVAEMERDNINKRTSGGRKVKAAKGGYAGGKAPFGYKVDNGKLVVNPSEAEIVNIIFDLKDNGSTMQEITEYLNNNGYLTRKNKFFVISTIQSILGNRKTYEGMYRYGKNSDWVKGQHEPILKV